MPMQLTFKNMATSLSLERYSREKLGSLLAKFFCPEPQVHLTFHIDGLKHIAHCHLYAGKVYDISISASSESMYASIDKLIAKLQRRLHKEKSRKLEYKHWQSKFDRQLYLLEVKNAALDEQEEMIDASDIVHFEQLRKAAKMRA